LTIRGSLGEFRKLQAQLEMMKLPSSDLKRDLGDVISKASQVVNAEPPSEA
jgi:hypothetical protein